jgi:hypothetical protein
VSERSEANFRTKIIQQRIDYTVKIRLDGFERNSSVSRGENLARPFSHKSFSER